MKGTTWKTVATDAKNVNIGLRTEWGCLNLRRVAQVTTAALLQASLNAANVISFSARTPFPRVSFVYQNCSISL